METVGTRCTHRIDRRVHELRPGLLTEAVLLAVLPEARHAMIHSQREARRRPAWKSRHASIQLLSSLRGKPAVKLRVSIEKTPEPGFFAVAADVLEVTEMRQILEVGRLPSVPLGPWTVKREEGGLVRKPVFTEEQLMTSSRVSKAYRHDAVRRPSPAVLASSQRGAYRRKNLSLL